MNTIIKDVNIKAVSSCLPESVLDMKSLISLYGEKDVMEIMKTTGIEYVRVVDNDTTSSDLCQKAAEYLIEKEGINRDDIDGLVFVSQTPDYILPVTSTCLQNRLGLSKGTVCMDIRYGCSGYIYGIFQAASWIACGACKNVLVLSGDTNSKLVNKNDRSLKMVMGDAGTATLVSVGNSSMGFQIHSDGSGADKLIVPAGGFRSPVSEKTAELKWDEDHNGRTQEDMYMDGMAIFMFAITQVPKNINSIIDRMGWNKEEVGLFALHQANKFMVDYIGKKLKVSSNLVPVNATKYGNTGPATIPLLLSDMCSTNQYNLSKTILSGFGVGLSWGSVACNLSQAHFYEPISY